jgi:proteasome activator subunit 4
MLRMFSTQSMPEYIAKSVVLLYGRYESVRPRFESLVDYLEQYYHPSNGGTWTSSLERLLRFLVMSFLKRLASEK